MHESNYLQALLPVVFTLGSCQQLSSAQQPYLYAARSASCVVSSCLPQLPATPLCAATTVCRLHNLAHVELNAVDLAWDTVARFSHLGLDQVRCHLSDIAHMHVGCDLQI